MLFINLTMKIMATEKVLNIVSENYPYGTGEQFFDAEVKELSRYFDKIQLFPLQKREGLRELPENVFINDVLAKTPRKISKSQVLKYVFRILKIVFFEWTRSNKKVYILKKIKRWTVSIIQCSILGENFIKEIDLKEENYFYSFWMNDGALLLSILRDQNCIEEFNFRVNGFDIFNERQESGYMPFRYYNYSLVNKVFVLSNEAYNYLHKLNCYPEKLRLSHYGIFENSQNKLKDDQKWRIVSCANVIPLKRIDKIISALSIIKDKSIVWTHFGDGYLMDDIKEKASKLGDNVHVDLRGNVLNSEIIETYQNEPVNLFVHTSETEGLGMAIIEAQSFGIPVVVIGVGGVPDIVSEATGEVLSPESEGPELAAAIKRVLNSEKNTNEYRTTIQKQIYYKFSAEKNYEALFQKLITNS